MRKHVSLALAGALFVLLSGCGGSGGGSGPLPTHSATPAPPLPQASNVQFVLHIPALTSTATAAVANSGVRPKDFSASTQSVKVAIGRQVLVVADVSTTSPLCKAASGGGRDCTIGVAAPNGNDQFLITAYDQPNATGNAIAQATLQAAVSAQPTTVNVAVAGTVVKLKVALSNSYPPIGTAVSVNVIVTALDVDGNAVLGSYTSPISLQDSDTSGATSLSATAVGDASSPIVLNYTGAKPFGSATITASLSGVASASTTFAPSPSFLNAYPVPQVPVGRGGMGYPGIWNIAKGSDGNMWAVATGYAEVLKVAQDGTMTAYPVSDTGDQLQGLVAGSDGNLWFAETGNNSIGKITTSGAVTEYPLPYTVAALPTCVGLGKDGNVWFWDDWSQLLGSITPSGTVTEYQFPSTASINGIVTGADGNLWMTDIGDNAILKASISGQLLATYPIPTNNSQPYGLAAGPDGNVWFTEFNANKVARITPSGTVSEFALPSGSGAPIAITAGPDGRMWFAEMGPAAGVGKIGYITVDGTQSRDFFSDGDHVHDLAFDANGTLWFLGLRQLSFFGTQEIGTFAY